MSASGPRLQPTLFELSKPGRSSDKVPHPPRDALDRIPAEHRRDHGFAPQVRIGLHAAEATRVAGDFEGAGVHAAARVGALAGGGEILVSTETIEGLDVPTTGEAREVSLKGLAKPVTVVAVDWRAG